MRRTPHLLCWLWFVLVLAVTPAAHAQGLGAFVSPGPLTSAHSDLDSFSGCTSCHELGGGPSAGKCMDCHEEIQEQVDQQRGYHKDKGKACESCHPEHRGRDFKLIKLEKSDFNHDETGFELRGAHERAECEECHTDPKTFTGLDPACMACHDDPHNSAESDRKLLGDRNCASCHSDESWDALPLALSLFDHTKKSDVDYILEHDHIDVDCEACHVDWKFVPLEYDRCEDCHRDPHRADFGKQKCEDCHPIPKGWVVPNFNHDQTPYRLEGLHAKVPSCTDCHGAHKTEPLAYGLCSDCHGFPHDHQFEPTRCDTCHDVFIADFLMPEFDHDKTKYPLVGKHTEVTCIDCHGEGKAAVYVGLAFEDCDSCHEDSHEGRYEPTDCKTCHIEDGFEVAAFDHDKTAFPHTGKHIGLDCNLCHQDNSWTGIAFASCDDCHHEENPHRSVVGPDQCEDCHVTDGFATMTFDHVGVTGFDLLPQHENTACTDCHEVLYHFAGLDETCSNCHLAVRPTGHYEGDCADCHQAAGWFPAGLGDNDHSITGFPLHGAHKPLPCESCHEPNRPRGEAVPDCSWCHAADDPHKHMLGNACADCHTDMSWFQTRWRHHQTGWPLRGSHRLAACVDCHAVGYIGTPTDCWRCHEAEAPMNIPQHLSPAFQNCDYCHRPYTWQFAARGGR